MEEVEQQASEHNNRSYYYDEVQVQFDDKVVIVRLDDHTDTIEISDYKRLLEDFQIGMNR